MNKGPKHSSERDFDFLAGRWTVKHHRLERRFAQWKTWHVADATFEMRKTLLGQGNIDHLRREFDGAPYEGMSIRVFNPETRLWSIYWLDTLNRYVEPPVHGAFDDGVGVLFGDDQWEGQPVRVRYIWSNITEHSARWEQAFSIDREQSWETNSIMEFTRI